MFIVYYDDGSILHLCDECSSNLFPVAAIPKLVYPNEEPDSYVISVEYLKECDSCETNCEEV